jgi:hypothetical protein
MGSAKQAIKKTPKACAPVPFESFLVWTRSGFRLPSETWLAADHRERRHFYG